MSVYKAGMKKFSQNIIIYHPRTIHFMLCWMYFFSLVYFGFCFHCSRSCSFSYSFAAIQNERVNERILNSHTTFFPRWLLLPFQDFHLLLFRKMYVFRDLTLDFFCNFGLFVSVLVYTITYHTIHIKGILLVEMNSMAQLSTRWGGRGKKIIHTQNFFALCL